MIVAPIGTYYSVLSVIGELHITCLFALYIEVLIVDANYVFKGSPTASGAAAALMANVVLVAYIVVAMKEDQSEAIEAAEKERKAR